MNLQKLLTSEPSYQKLHPKTIESIKIDPDKENTLRNIVLFCKQVFSSNSNQRKKYLCLLFIKDIFEAIHSEYYEKLVDEYLASKIFHAVQTYVEGKTKDTKYEDKETIEKVYALSVQTIIFWAKRLSFMQKSAFAQMYIELKKLKIELPRQFVYYKQDMLLQLWKSGQHDHSIRQNSSALIMELDSKFKHCKDQLQKQINQSVANDEQVSTKNIIDSLREYLLFFFSNYRQLESEQASQRDIVIVYFHILNNMYKRICNRINLSIQEVISITKQIFDAVYPSDYQSVDRMDMIELAGVFKYNALTVFQRIHQRIEREDAILGTFKLNLNLQLNQRPPLPSGLEGSMLSGSRVASTHRFARTNNI